MDKETLSNYGWIVICVMILAVMIALATPFGSFVSDAVKSTTQGLFDVNQSALDAAGIVIDSQDFKEKYNHSAPELHPTGTIPEGGKYVTANGTTLQAGANFPKTVNTGDRYIYEDYEYRYNQYSFTWKTNESQNGWGVLVKDKTKTSYSVILESINGLPVTTMQYTFDDCRSLIVSPVIPKNVNDVTGIFRNCHSLTTGPVLPSSVTTIESLFSNCYELKTYHGSTSADGDFSNYIVPESVTNMRGTFFQCRKMIKAPKIPKNVTTIQNLFYGCISLVEAPVIPENVTDVLYCTFRECTSLTGTVIINAQTPDTTAFNGIDFKAQNLTLSGSATNLDNLASAFTTNYCRTCNGKCNGGH